MVEKKEDKVSLDYFAARDKLFEVAKDFEKLYKEHVEEYNKMTFLDDKIAVLEKALEYATICIKYLKEAIERQESREAFYNELKNLFTQTALERVKVIMALACKSSPAQPVSVVQIAKWIYGDSYNEKQRTVQKNVEALKNFGIVTTRKEGRELKVVMVEHWREIFQHWVQGGFFEAGRRFK